LSIRTVTFCREWPQCSQAPSGFVALASQIFLTRIGPWSRSCGRTTFCRAINLCCKNFRVSCHGKIRSIYPALLRPVRYPIERPVTLLLSRWQGLLQNLASCWSRRGTPFHRLVELILLSAHAVSSLVHSELRPRCAAAIPFPIERSTSASDALKAISADCATTLAINLRGSWRIFIGS
jgi:hypothetical protein